MKKKNNIRAKGKEPKAVSSNPDSHRGEVGSAKRGQSGVAPTCLADRDSDPRLRNCGLVPKLRDAAPTERNSTVPPTPLNPLKGPARRNENVRWISPLGLRGRTGMRKERNETVPGTSNQPPIVHMFVLHKFPHFSYF